MHQDPTTGIQGAKPKLSRFKSAKQALPLLSKTYLEQRNEQMRAKNQSAQLLLARARSELIEKELVVRQASYLLVSLRQKILSMPLTYSQRLLNISDARVMNGKLKEVAISLLNELKDLPQAAIDPGWLKKLDGAEDGK